MQYDSVDTELRTGAALHCLFTASVHSDGSQEHLKIAFNKTYFFKARKATLGHFKI